MTGYLKKLKEFLNSPAGKKGDSEDVKIKQIALRSTENLQVDNYIPVLALIAQRLPNIQQRFDSARLFIVPTPQLLDVHPPL